MNDKKRKKVEKYEYDLERREIAELCSRTDLVCPYCKINNTKASKRTGQLLPCKRCYNKRIGLMKYGITLKYYWDIYNKQNGKCAICDTTLSPPHVDHCHDFKHIRGLLCAGCNTGLGAFKDNIESLYRAAKYLKMNALSLNWRVQDEISLYQQD